ncbi:MAG: hypothetical protein R2780_14820 [Crocinitomicaceae bacterium]|nr:hypothetical protein [Crocinitomicaceae bacterium]
MTHDQLISNYLERVLKFKANLEFHDRYLDEQGREKLLKDLFDLVEFDRHLWKERKREAQKAFFCAMLVKEDDKMESIAPATWKYLSNQYAKQAIALDPFNEKFLETYVTKTYDQLFEDNEDLKRRYLSLFDPNSNEYLNHQIDLKLTSNKEDYDYLNEKVTDPFIRELVFMKERLEATAIPKNGDEELKNIALEGGIDQQTIQMLEKELPEHLKTINRVFSVFWDSWQEVQKAYLSLQIVTDLAPYNEEVLESAICFYAHTHWRVLLDYSKLDDVSQYKKEYYNTVFGTEKPTREQLITEVRSSIQKARTLEKRYAAVVAQKNPKSDPTLGSAEWFKEFKRSFDSNDLIGNITDRRDQPVELFLEALVETEEKSLNVFLAHKKMKRSNFIIGFVITPLLAIIIGYVAYLISPAIVKELLPLLAVGFAVMGILHLRELWWKKKVHVA